MPPKGWKKEPQTRIEDVVGSPATLGDAKALAVAAVNPPDHPMAQAIEGRPVTPDKPILIALCGPKGSGKTSLAKMAEPTAIVSFAKPLKMLAKKIFHMTDEQVYGAEKEVPFPVPIHASELQLRQIVRFMANEIVAIRNESRENKIHFAAHGVAINKLIRGPFVSPRDLMQKLGTEIMQSIYRPFSPLVTMWPYRNKPGVYIIDDMRFPMEDEMAKDMYEYYYPLRIVGRNEDCGDGHASERAWKDIAFFDTIDSSGNLKDFKKKAEVVFTKIKDDVRKRMGAK